MLLLIKGGGVCSSRLQQAGGVEAPFDWLAAGGTPAVFTRHQQLISRAWKST